jgi:hypothetical protein
MLFQTFVLVILMEFCQQVEWYESDINFDITAGGIFISQDNFDGPLCT